MPEFEEITNIAARVITLLDRQRNHNSDATSATEAFAELEKLNAEVKTKYGAPPEGWGDFYMRANTYLELSERHRGDGGPWARRLDDVRGKVLESKDFIFTAELQRQSRDVKAKEQEVMRLNREDVKTNAHIYQQAKAAAAKTGARIEFTD